MLKGKSSPVLERNSAIVSKGVSAGPVAYSMIGKLIINMLKCRIRDRELKPHIVDGIMEQS